MVVDIVILVIILGFAIIGYKKGLTASIIKIVSLLISIIIALILYKPVSNFIINNTPIGANIENAVTNTFITTDGTEVKVKTNAPTAIEKYLNEIIEESQKTAQNAAVETVAKTVSEAIVRVCILIALIIITNVIILIIRFFTNILTDLPVIKQADELGGLIYGIVEAVLIIYVIFAILSFINNDNINNSIHNSFIGNALYNNNIILNLFFK